MGSGIGARQRNGRNDFRRLPTCAPFLVQPSRAYREIVGIVDENKHGYTQNLAMLKHMQGCQVSGYTREGCGDVENSSFVKTALDSGFFKSNDACDGGSNDVSL